VEPIISFLSFEMSQAQPLPNLDLAESENCFLNSSSDPKLLLMAVSNFSEGWPDLSAEMRDFQNSS